MLRLTALLIALLCAAPLLIVLSGWAWPLSVPSAANWQHIRDTVLTGYISQTTWLCIGVMVLCAVLGTATAWVTSYFSFPGRRWLEWLLILPLAMPAYISAYAYGWLLDYAGPVQSGLREMMDWSRGDYWFPQVRSLGGAVWMLGLATMPYVYMLARTAFLSQPREWWEAASSLGTYPAGFFRRVALPAARPFIVAGVALALMETIADIGTVTVLGVQTLSAGIYRTWFFLNEPMLAARLAGILLVFVFILLALEGLSRVGMRYSSQRPQRNHTRLELRGKWRVVAWLVCALPVIGGFFLPLAVLVRLVAYHESAIADMLMDYGWQTLKLGALAGLLVGGAALLMVCSERFYGRWLRAVTLFASLGYAIPGAVLAVGLLLMFGALREVPGLAGMLMGGTSVLMIAYVVRFMATAYGPLHSGMLRIPAEFDMAAASLGAGKAGIIRRVHAPLLALPFTVAYVMVFLDVIKELPATLILRAFDQKPLAIAVYEFASDDRPVEASPYALVLVAVATLGVLLLHKIQQQVLEKQHGTA